MTSENENKSRSTRGGRAPYAHTQRSERRAVQEPVPTAEPKVKKKRFNLRKLLLVLIPVLAVAGVVVLLLSFARKITDYTMEEPMVQHYAGNTFTLPVGELHINDDGDTELVTDENTTELSSLPLYSTERDLVVLPKDMVYYEPTNNIKLRVDHFSTVAYRSGTSTISQGKRSEKLTSGFLFDGEDVYLFLQPVTLRYNNYTIELGAMSYLEVNRELNICYYDFKTGENNMDTARTAVEIIPKFGGYTVELLNDSLELEDGTKILLFNRADLLDPLL